MCDRELVSPSSRCLCSHSPRLFQVPAPGTGGFALPQPTNSGCVATSSWGLLLFPLQIKPALPVPAEQSSKAKQTRFLSGFPGRAAVVYVGPILLFLPVGLGGAGWGSEAGEGFAAVPAQPLGSCLALRGDLQLPPGLLKGLIYVLLSVFCWPCCSRWGWFGALSCPAPGWAVPAPWASGDSELGLLILQHSQSHSCHVIALHIPLLHSKLGINLRIFGYCAYPG